MLIVKAAPAHRTPKPAKAAEVERGSPSLERKLQAMRKAWGNRPTIIDDPQRPEVLDSLPAETRRKVEDQYLDELIDVRSPCSVTVYRAITRPPEEFDPNRHFQWGQADAVSLHPLLGFAGQDGGTLVTFQLPACFLDYNRGEYIISPEKIAALCPTLEDLSPFITSVTRVPPTSSFTP
jgi:hypothetical protein